MYLIEQLNQFKTFEELSFERSCLRSVLNGWNSLTRRRNLATVKLVRFKNAEYYFLV